ncbi:MAG: hypothetical protein ABIX46_08105 [Burkholderiaceae bacterium]
MNHRIKQLRDLVVALDLADRNLQPLAADAYQDAARQAQRLTREEMGLLPIGDFAGPVNSLQAIAENIFFVSNGCFADLDGSGRAAVALLAGTALIERVRVRPQPRVDARQVADALMVRLRGTEPTAPARLLTPRRRTRRSLDDRA